jgi:Zn-dependent protease
MSVVIHEVSHGYAALALGDRTAEYEGRLTLNPVKHIDLWGSIIFPSVSYFLGGFIFGWAKPVPFNPYNLRNQKWGEAIVAIAGPASNLIIAIVFGLGMRFLITDLSTPLAQIVASVVLTNLILAFFNLMPIPPLDGSKILTSVMPAGFMAIRQKIEQFGFVAVLIFALVLWQFVTPLISFVFYLITGVKV